jgi:hypothetical protein
MAAKFPAMKMPKGAFIDNEAHHNFTDANNGGGPAMRNRSAMSMRGRSGAGTNANGRDPAPSASLGGRGGSGMPSGSFRSEGRDSSTAETRVPSHGGSPQHRERMDGAFEARGGVAAPGQSGLPNYRGTGTSNLQRNGGNVTGAGNTSGRSQRLIAGRFKRAAMGARSSGSESKGSYGAAPVTANT